MFDYIENNLVPLMYIHAYVRNSSNFNIVQLYTIDIVFRIKI
jgi:hypothetical protein